MMKKENREEEEMEGDDKEIENADVAAKKVAGERQRQRAAAD